MTAEIVSQKFCKEVVLWNSLSHPNILKLFGVLGGIGQYQFATVSEWMVHGTIMEYIRENATNRLELGRVFIFRGERFPNLTSVTAARCGARAGVSPRRGPCPRGSQRG